MHDPRNPSRFAPTQLLLAHAAIAEDGAAALRHDQRSARAGFGLAAASESDTDVAIGDDWRLARTPDDRYLARIRARDFTLELTMTPPGPPCPCCRASAPTEATSWRCRTAGSPPG